MTGWNYTLLYLGIALLLLRPISRKVVKLMEDDGELDGFDWGFVTFFTIIAALLWPLALTVAVVYVLIIAPLKKEE